MTSSRAFPALWIAGMLLALSSSMAAPSGPPAVNSTTTVYRCKQGESVLFSQTPCDGGQAKAVSRDVRTEAQVHEALVRHADHRKVAQASGARGRQPPSSLASQPASQAGSLSGSRAQPPVLSAQDNGRHRDGRKPDQLRADRSKLFTARAPRHNAAAPAPAAP